jgi:hypothetical protein
LPAARHSYNVVTAMDTNDRQIAIADLKLSLFLRPLHPEFFDIRATRNFDQTGFGGCVWLIDSGHVITFIDGPNAITEVMAPREMELPKRGLVRTVDMVGEHDHRLETRGPIVYQMAYQVDSEGPDTYLREAEDLLASARQGHLFSESPHDAAKRPFSYAVPEPRGTGLLVHTWHGFPAENTILKTQTLIERVML